MKIRRAISVFLALALVFSLCACGKDSGKNEVTKPEESQGVSVGVTSNNRYENSYFGIGVTLDDNWVFKTQEEIDEINVAVKDVINSDQFDKALDSGVVYTDMYVADKSGLVNMNTTIEKLSGLNAIAIDEEKYVDIALENNNFKAIFKEMGLDVTTIEKSFVTIAGVEHPCIVMEGNIQGTVGFYEKVIAIKKKNYVLTISVSAIVENTVDDVLSNIKPL